MGQTIVATVTWECDGCDRIQQLQAGINPGGSDEWRQLRTYVPVLPELDPRLAQANPTETGQDWLFCRPCYARATGSLNALQDPSVWVWTGDPDEDQVESVGGAMVVQITGAQLRALIVKAAREERQGLTEAADLPGRCDGCRHPLGFHGPDGCTVAYGAQRCSCTRPGR